MRRRKPRRLIVAAVTLPLFVAAGYLVFAPIPIEPQSWTPSPIPALTGALAENTAIKEQVVRFARGLGRGPEDVTVKDGYAYTGVEDGRILKIAMDGTIIGTVADTGGRPLGLQHDAQGNLIVADAIKGLLSVTGDGEVTVRRKMIFVDDLDIAADGVIWFSDASQRFGYGKHMLDAWEGSATGRLLNYNPTTRKTQIVVEGLRFANGVAVAHDQSFVLVAESFGRRIHKHWLQGVKAGRTEILVDGLPGYPDNLSAAPGGIFWVALHSPASKDLESLHTKPFLRSVIYRLYRLGLFPDPPGCGWIIAIDENGGVIANAMDPSGESYHPITSVNEFTGELFMGSNVADSMARMPVPTTRESTETRPGGE